MSDLQAQAVASVQSRGFYEADAIPTNAKNPLLMAQFLRLVEEVGELGRALRKDAGTDEEAADVLVVLYQISHICGIALEEATRTKILADEQRGHLHNGRSRVRLVEADELIGGAVHYNNGQNATAQDVVDRREARDLYCTQDGQWVNKLAADVIHPGAVWLDASAYGEAFDRYVLGVKAWGEDGSI